jgi:CRP/FNR family cyclic AMP-dependent transcriptional regulator
MVDPDLLRRCLHLSDLSDGILSRISAIASESQVGPDTRLFSDMDPADKLYLVVKGEVRLCCEMGSGELRPMDTVNDGELFAWSSLVEPFRYTSTAITSGPTQLITFDAPQLRRLCEADQELGYQILSKVVKLLSHRLESVRVQLAGS